jgi:hypothetical protein
MQSASHRNQTALIASRRSELQKEEEEKIRIVFNIMMRNSGRECGVL